MSCSSEDHQHASLPSPSPSSSSLSSLKVDESSKFKIKMMCSEGGKIVPSSSSSSTNQLRYVGGHTRLFVLHTNISYADLMAKVEKQFGPNLMLKYQLPNEDLDALISVTCDEDVENMVDEYDRNGSTAGSSRLRAFLFPSIPPLSSGGGCQKSIEDSKSADDKYVQSINTASLHGRKLSDSSADSLRIFEQPDYLFGLDCPRKEDEKSYMLSKGEKSSSFPSKPMLVDSLRQKSSSAKESGRVQELGLPPSSPSPKQKIWDPKKIWEEAFSTRGDEKRSSNNKVKRGDANAEEPKEKLIATYLPSSCIDAQGDGSVSKKPLERTIQYPHEDSRELNRSSEPHAGWSTLYQSSNCQPQEEEQQKQQKQQQQQQQQQQADHYEPIRVKNLTSLPKKTSSDNKTQREVNAKPQEELIPTHFPSSCIDAEREGFVSKKPMESATKYLHEDSRELNRSPGHHAGWQKIVYQPSYCQPQEEKQQKQQKQKKQEEEADQYEPAQVNNLTSFLKKKSFDNKNQTEANAEPKEKLIPALLPSICIDAQREGFVIGKEPPGNMIQYLHEDSHELNRLPNHNSGRKTLYQSSYCQPQEEQQKQRQANCCEPTNNLASLPKKKSSDNQTQREANVEPKGKLFPTQLPSSCLDVQKEGFVSKEPPQNTIQYLHEDSRELNRSSDHNAVRQTLYQPSYCHPQEEEQKQEEADRYEPIRANKVTNLPKKTEIPPNAYDQQKLTLAQHEDSHELKRSPDHHGRCQSPLYQPSYCQPQEVQLQKQPPPPPPKQSKQKQQKQAVDHFEPTRANNLTRLPKNKTDISLDANHQQRLPLAPSKSSS